MKSADRSFMIAVKYSLFAILATACNLIVQYICFLFYAGEKSIYLALLVGTMAGLVSKYFMDKYYIFNQSSQSQQQSSEQFFYYSLTGVFTTSLFWGAELSFNAIFESEKAKYIGALLGLGTGYFIKYRLDKKYVFKECQYESR